METNALSKAAAKSSAKPTTTAVATAQGGQVAKAKSPKQSLSDQIVALMLPQEKSLKETLNGKVEYTSFVRSVCNTVIEDPKLQQAIQASPKTFFDAVRKGAEYGLEFNKTLGYAYLIPFNNKRYRNGEWEKVLEVQFQPGYRGIRKLLLDTKEVKLIDAQPVYAKEVETGKFKLVRGINPEFKHEPICFGDRGEIVGYYGLVVMMDPSIPPIVETMSKDDVIKFAKQYSKTYNKEKNTFSGPWGSDFDSMAKKTLMLKAMKNAPIKNEFINTIVAEETEPEVDDNLTRAEAIVNAVSESPLNNAEPTPKEETQEEPPPEEGDEG